MTLEQLAVLLHTFFCVKKHEEDMLKLKMQGCTEDNCLWYLEECLDKPWERDTHKEWLETARMFASVIEQNAPGELSKYLQALRELLRNYVELCDVGLGSLIDLLFIKNTITQTFDEEDSR